MIRPPAGSYDEAMWIANVGGLIEVIFSRLTNKDRLRAAAIDPHSLCAIHPASRMAAAMHNGNNGYGLAGCTVKDAERKSL